MVVEEVRHYLEYGNIQNSVNLPDCILHQNVPTIIFRFLEGISTLGLNIKNLINKSWESIAYTIIDLNGNPGTEVVTAIREMKDMIRVRMIYGLSPNYGVDY